MCYCRRCRGRHPGRLPPRNLLCRRKHKEADKDGRRFWQDLRYGALLLVKHSGFSLIAIIMLAAGIGANTAVLRVVNAPLLKPLPVAQPDELVYLYTSDFSGPRWLRLAFNKSDLSI